MKIDPYKHKERYLKWKEKTEDRISEMSQINSDLTLEYLKDMEKGFNVANKSVKGPRSFIRLNSIKDKMFFFSRKFKEIYNWDNITLITEEQLIDFFHSMANGTLIKEKGGTCRSVETYTKTFFPIRIDITQTGDIFLINFILVLTIKSGEHYTSKYTASRLLYPPYGFI